jgi:predicted TIM-barrel fold metal-dependent hydrolase
VIIDAHLHLDERVDGTAFGAAMELDRQLAAADVDAAVVLHLQQQPWSAEEFAAAIEHFPRLRGFINVHPAQAQSQQILAHAIENLGYIGLKLHPRLQGFAVDDPQTSALVKAAGELNVPVLIDAFPDGTHLLQGFSAIKYALLARECPQTRIIWAHMGGHHVLDFMMLAKRLPNVYLDFSYSLLYYQTSAVPQNMVYAMRSLKFERIFYGSDYPDRSIAETLKFTLDYLLDSGLSEEEITRVMGLNAQQFFGWCKV